METRLRTDQLVNWLKPWPIQLSGKHVWKISFKTAQACGKYLYANRFGKKRIPIRDVHKYQMLQGGYDHHVASLARSNPVKPVIVVYDNWIVDGNHTLLAVLRVNPKQMVMVCESHS